MTQIKKNRNRKQFHPFRTFRINDGVYQRMLALKKGTWSYFFTQLLDTYEKTLPQKEKELQTLQSSQDGVSEEAY